MKRKPASNKFWHVNILCQVSVTHNYGIFGINCDEPNKDQRKKVQSIKKLFDYCATHPDDKIRYNQSNMLLRIHSDGS